MIEISKRMKQTVWLIILQYQGQLLFLKRTRYHQVPVSKVLLEEISHNLVRSRRRRG